MFGRATITFGIGPHSSWCLFLQSKFFTLLSTCNEVRFPSSLRKSVNKYLYLYLHRYLLSTSLLARKHVVTEVEMCEL